LTSTLPATATGNGPVSSWAVAPGSAKLVKASTVIVALPFNVTTGVPGNAKYATGISWSELRSGREPSPGNPGAAGKSALFRAIAYRWKYRRATVFSRT
jgi:hypothetical protein